MKQIFIIIFCLLSFVSFSQMVEGTAETYYYGEQKITTYFDGEKYQLRDIDKNFSVINLNGKNKEESKTPIFANTNNWRQRSFLENIIVEIDSDYWKRIRNSPLNISPKLYLILYDLNDKIILRTTSAKKSLKANFYYNYYIPSTAVKAEVYHENVFLKDKLISTFKIPFKQTSSSEKFIDDNNNILQTTVKNEKNPALDIYWGLQNSYNYFEEVHKRKSVDGKNGQIFAFINIKSDKNISGNRNFAWAFSNLLDHKIPHSLGFGLGDSCFSNPWVEQDIIGHEYLHLILNQNNILKYEGESGALNESLADMFGELVEYYVSKKIENFTTTPWEITSTQKFNSPSVRSMKNPSADNFKRKYTGCALVKSITNRDSIVVVDRRSPTYYNYNPLNHRDQNYSIYWQDVKDVSAENDYGNVHTNSGIGNFWFYLLTDLNNGNPNTGTNIIGQNFSVNAIGFEKIEKILYEVITNGTLGKKSGYKEFAKETLNTATEFFYQNKHGFTREDIGSIRDAWYAVGVIKNLNNFCETAIITDPYGFIEDGSLNENYNNNQNCSWQISPIGAENVLLKFKYINLAQGDTLKIYDGIDANATILKKIGIADNNTFPLEIKSTTSSVYLQFKTDANQVADGWNLEFEGIDAITNCNSNTFIYLANGILEDGSKTNNYTNNNSCSWTISPENATYIEIDFTLLDLESEKDFIKIYKGTNSNSEPLAKYTGNILPDKLNIPSGEVFLTFSTDYKNTKQGWSFNFSSDGIEPCSSNITLTEESGVVSDGSGENNYGNNANCTWLIKPENSTSITLNFDELNLQVNTIANNLTTDYLEIYDAETEDSEKLIQRFTGNQFLPLRIQSSSGAIFVKFVSDNSITDKGWQFSYTSFTEDVCSGTTILKNETGSFEAGRNGNNYAVNSDCRWLIQPENAISIELNFSSFETETGKDGVVIYDGPNTSYPYKVYSGATIPNTIYSKQGAILVRFISDSENNFKGFKANYKANIAVDGNVNSIAQYQYWFNNDFDDIISSSNFAANNNLVIDKEIDISNLKNGLNTFHFRTKDNNGIWSSVISDYIYVRKQISMLGTKITSYKYWLNNSYENVIKENIEPKESFILIDELELSDLNNNSTNYIHFQFKDTFGNWSSVLTQEFVYDKTLSLDSFGKDNFKVFPNPTDDRINILSPTNVGKLKVFNSLGILVLEKTNIPQILDFSNFSAGFYLVRIETENKTIQTKIIKN